MELNGEHMADEVRVTRVDSGTEVGVGREGQAVGRVAGAEEGEETVLAGGTEVAEDDVGAKKRVELRELDWGKTVVVTDEDLLAAPLQGEQHKPVEGEADEDAEG